MVNHAYRQHRLLGWTRIDMLVALYDAALLKLEQAMQAGNDGHALTARRRSLEALRLVAQLNAGIARQYGNLADNLANLFHFVSLRILADDGAGLADAHRILETLRAGFSEIRDEAVELESEGVIPQIEEMHACNRTA